MTSRREQLEALAALFTYPGNGYAAAAESVAASSGSAARSLLVFASEVRRMPLTALQELYTATFDLQPACALDLGWHLFGEDYQHGVLLSRMRRELRAYGIAETGELPDHLSHALLLLGRMGPAQAEEFAAAIVVPAVEHMLQRMPSENVFRGLLQAVQQVTSMHFPAAFEPVSPIAEGAML